MLAITINLPLLLAQIAAIHSSLFYQCPGVQVGSIKSSLFGNCSASNPAISNCQQECNFASFIEPRF